MTLQDSNGRGSYPDDDEEFEDDEYDTMELLDRLETLREDMEDLGVTSLQEVIQRINDLHQQLDAQR